MLFRRAILGCYLLAMLTATALPALASVSDHEAQPSPPSPVRFVVVLDPAHGGSDPGAKLSPALKEKIVTLALARRLRFLLAAHGISVVMTRTGNTNPPLATRAGVANHADAAACLILHVTASGVGLHLFTSSLSPEPRSAVPLWATAQAGYVNQSLRLSSDIDNAFAHTSIPVILGRTYLDPLDNLTCPAVAIELAPKSPHGLARAQSVDNPAYQTIILKAIVAGLLQWRQDWSHEKKHEPHSKKPSRQRSQKP